ncbi:MAG: Nramp family divalent metal transporter [Gemmatimonadaceae bacterium]
MLLARARRNRSTILARCGVTAIFPAIVNPESTPEGAAGAPDTLRATDAEGREYRDGVYRPLVEETLAVAPEDGRFPARGHGPPFHVHDEVPRVPRLAHLIGPSIIALGMGLGAGEFLLWPNLIAVNGWSIWWLFWVGVLTQYVVISEIERWTIATGESVFGGMARLDRWAFWPWFFLAATLVSFFWPGWASQSAEFTGEIIAAATGERIAWQPIALAMLFFIWLGLAASKIVYNALERLEIVLVLSFFPMLAVSLLVVGVLPDDVLGLVRGAVSIGSAPEALLTGEQFPTLLIAVAYAGSGGTLLLAQSLWLRDKGFGMACYQGRIAGIRGRNEQVSETGYVFDPDRSPLSLARFREWVRVAERELFVTFVLLIILSVIITTLLVASTVGVGNSALAGDLSGMVALQGDVLERSAGLWLKVVFLLGGAFVLFSTQLGIVDTVTRIAGSIFYERYGCHTRFWSLKRTFLFFLTAFVLASMVIVVVSWVGGETVDRLQPNFLVLIAGPFTIASMYAFALVVGYMNIRRLPASLGMPAWKRWGMLWAAVLWGWFTAEQLSRVALAQSGAAVAAIERVAWHPLRVAFYAAWLGSIIWFGWIVLRGHRRPWHSSVGP